MGRKTNSFRSAGLVALDAADAFDRHSGFTVASSLAFFTTVSLIPGLMLLGQLQSVSVWFSDYISSATRCALQEFIPDASADVIGGIFGMIGPGSSMSGAMRLINLGVLLWAMSPLAGTMRAAFRVIFRAEDKRHIVLGKLLDMLLAAAFVAVFAGVAAGSVLLDLLPPTAISHALRTTAPILLIFLSVYLAYLALAPGKGGGWPLVLGALAATLLWFGMRPGFSLFLTYNKGFGLMYGSLKSLFVAVFWVYMSHCAFLYGAELASAIKRKDAMLIHRMLLKGKRTRTGGRFVSIHAPGERLFSETEASSEMFYLLSGRVRILKRGTELAELGPGSFVGEMSFLLEEPRSADVEVSEDAELVRISRDQFDLMTREFPDLASRMLKDLAARLRETSRLVA